MQDFSQKYIARISRWLARPYREVGQSTSNFGALATCTGLVRKANQDRVVIVDYSGFSNKDSFTAWILCDGIGGLREGDVAAGQAIASIIIGLITFGDIKLQSVVGDVVQQANRHVFDRFKEQGGCTLSFIVNSESSFFATNVGDSRIYRRKNQQIQQLSTDDTIGNQLRLLGGNELNLTGGLFNHHLSQYLGMEGELTLDTAQQFRLESSDNLILTSDGVHSIDKRVFDSVILTAPSPLEMVRRLIYISKWSGGKDNASAICIPSTLPKRTDFESGLLQIWDSFGCHEFFIDRSSLQQAIKQERLQHVNILDKAQEMTKNSNTISEKNGTESGSPRRRKARKKQDRPNPEVEIIDESTP